MAKRGRTAWMVGIVAAVAALLAWLGRFGLGFGVGPGETPTVPAPAPPQPRPEAREVTVVTVEGEVCRVGEALPQPCPAVCERLGETVQDVEIRAALGTHRAVEELQACLLRAGVARIQVTSE